MAERYYTSNLHGAYKDIERYDGIVTKFTKRKINKPRQRKTMKYILKLHTPMLPLRKKEEEQYKMIIKEAA